MSDFWPFWGIPPPPHPGLGHQAFLHCHCYTDFEARVLCPSLTQLSPLWRWGYLLRAGNTVPNCQLGRDQSLGCSESKSDRWSEAPSRGRLQKVNRLTEDEAQVRVLEVKVEGVMGVGRGWSSWRGLRDAVSWV